MKLYKLTLEVENWLPKVVVEYCRSINEEEAKKHVLNSFIYSRNKTKVLNIELV